VNKTHQNLEVTLTDEELRNVKICCTSQEWREGIIPMVAKMRKKLLDKLEVGSEDDSRVRGELSRLRMLFDLDDLVSKC